MNRLLSYLLVLSLHTAVVGTALAQDVGVTVQTGLHYFAVQNRDTGEVVQRGVAGAKGVAFDRLILPANTNFRAWVLQADTFLVGYSDFTTPRNGRRFTVPPIDLGESLTLDTDGDGLTEDAELVMGTFADNPDSDGDGLLDGAETQQGSNPLDGVPVRTGILGTADTDGSAVDVDAFNNLVAIADSSRGVSVFNVFNAMAPLIVAQIETPGDSQAVAIAGDLLAVADGASGLAVIDITEPPAASILRQTRFASSAKAVATDGDIAYVGLQSAAVVAVELTTGSVLNQFSFLGSQLEDVFLSGDHLYVYLRNSLRVLDIAGGILSQVGSTNLPNASFFSSIRHRVSVGGGIAYATHDRGFLTIDVSDPTSPSAIGTAFAPQAGWKQIVPNGSGLGFAAVGVNPRLDATAHVSLYDLSDPTNTNDFQTEFVTPGFARAVSIYNGLGYVADDQSGLQVVNYLAFDREGQAPQIQISTSLNGGVAEEGKRFRVSANVQDDVQVRNVEFYLDGVRVATDGSFPFEARLLAPLIDAQNRMEIQARASDTGGNATFSQTLSFDLVPDATPPRVVSSFPENGSVLGSVQQVRVTFSETMAVNTLTPQRFGLRSAGPDEVLGNADDIAFPEGARGYIDSTNTAFLDFNEPLPAGVYQIFVANAVTDLAGLTLEAPALFSFRVFGAEDDDNDGVPNDLEPLLGLDSLNPDSDGNGVPDGREDFDNDGLLNVGEVLLNTNAAVADSDENGVLDGDEDTDGDFLTDGREIELRTNPLLVDSDLDNWPDNDEIEFGGDPLNPNRGPRLFVDAVPTVKTAIVSASADVFAVGSVVAQPPVAVVIPGFEEGSGFAFGISIAQPPIAAVLPGFGTGPGFEFGLSVALPPTDVVIPNFGSEAGAVQGISIAQPPTQLVIPSFADSSGIDLGTTVAEPTTKVRIETE